ncbi:unnamed protein product, partial [Symbiodinium sp. CCMP2456]
DRQPLLPKGNLPFNFEVAMTLGVSTGEIRGEQAALRRQIREELALKKLKKRLGEDQLDGELEAKRARVQEPASAAPWLNSALKGWLLSRVLSNRQYVPEDSSGVAANAAVESDASMAANAAVSKVAAEAAVESDVDVASNAAIPKSGGVAADAAVESDVNMAANATVSKSGGAAAHEDAVQSDVDMAANAAVCKSGGVAAQAAVESDVDMATNAAGSKSDGVAAEAAVESDVDMATNSNAAVSKSGGVAAEAAVESVVNMADEDATAVESPAPNAIVAEVSGPAVAQLTLATAPDEAPEQAGDRKAAKREREQAKARENLQWLSLQDGISDCCPHSGLVDPSELKTLSFVVPTPTDLLEKDWKKYKSITVLLNNRAFYVNNSWVPCPGVKATWL